MADREGELATATVSLADRERELETVAESQIKQPAVLEDAINSDSRPADDTGSATSELLKLKANTIEDALAGLVQAAASLGKTFLDTEQAQFVGTLRSFVAGLSGDLGTIMALNRLDSGGLELASDMPCI